MMFLSKYKVLLLAFLFANIREEECGRKMKMNFYVNNKILFPFSYILIGFIADMLSDLVESVMNFQLSNGLKDQIWPVLRTIIV